MDHHSPVPTYPTFRPKANATPRTFFGEPTNETQQGEQLSAALTVQALTQLIRAVSTGLMGFAPEAWTAVRDTENVRALSEAVSELRATVAAISGGDGADGATPTGICLVATMREMLCHYRRRQQFVASNIPLSDPHSRGLLRELLDFDRWLGSHLERCSACQLVRGAQ